MKQEFKSFAKINLHLAVGPKRRDNFHDLQSIFAKIDLFDTLEIEAEISDELKIEVSGLQECQIEGEDTISKAIRLWCETANLLIDAKINVNKKIPIQAGLGGGSSNAATALLGINEMFSSHKIDKKQLIALGLKIGSDVPFFMSDTTFAYVEGRGEKITPLNNSFDYHICLIKPNRGVSTKGAFEELDIIERKVFKSKKELIDIFNGGLEKWKKNFYNDFELVIKSPILKQLRADDSLFSLMSGSGSTCYGIYNKNTNCYNKMTFFRKFKNKNYTKSCFFLNI